MNRLICYNRRGGKQAQPEGGEHLPEEAPDGVRQLLHNQQVVHAELHIIGHCHTCGVVSYWNTHMCHARAGGMAVNTAEVGFSWAYSW